MREGHFGKSNKLELDVGMLYVGRQKKEVASAWERMGGIYVAKQKGQRLSHATDAVKGNRQKAMGDLTNLR